jgi:hypothetical protein
MSALTWREMHNSVLEQYAHQQIEVEKLRKIANIAEDMVSIIGAYGEIDSRHKKTDELLHALTEWHPKYIQESK